MVELWLGPGRRLIADAEPGENGANGLGWWIVVAGLIFATGCTPLGRGVQRGRMAYQLGDFTTAQTELAKVAESRSPAASAAKLDLAMAQMAGGQADDALQTLRQLRDHFDHDSGLSAAGNVVSLVADDNLREYRPAGYEQVMIRSMLSLCSLTVDDGDADSYALQAQMRQAELARQAESRGLGSAGEVYQPLALAPYLRGVLREATLRDYDDASRAYQLVSQLQPGFAPAAGDIARCLDGVHSAPGHGVLYVIAMVGRGPVLEEVDAEVTTAALQIASQVHSLSQQDRMALPNLVSVKVAQPVVPWSPAAAVSLESSGVWLGATQPLVDIGEMAIRQGEAEMPWTLARAIARRVTKQVAVDQATRGVGLTGVGGELAKFATVNVWSFTERADTRCWGLLPRQVQVLRAELPVGVHRIASRVVGSQGHPLGATTYTEVEIEDGRNAYLTIFASDREAFVARTPHIGD